MAVLLVAWLVVLGCTLVLRALNLRHLRRHGGTVPSELAGTIDPDLLQRVAVYTLENSRLETTHLVVESLLAGTFFFAGILGAYDAWIAGFDLPFVWSGMLFFAGLFAVETSLRIPFSLVRHFRIETRHGFNRMSFRLWLADLLKSLALSLLLLSIVAGGALLLVTRSPEWWWLWVWAFFFAVSLLLLYIAPYVIEPLFFKLEPVRVAGLEERIRELMERAGLGAPRVFQVDASRRSTHSNAYFTGLGRVQRIVLFDTLLEQLGPSEILGVLAHEAGHWKKRHVVEKIALTEAIALVCLFAASHLVGQAGLSGLAGLDGASFHARVVILAFIGSLVAFPLTPLASWHSRRHEWQADGFAVALTREPEQLASALAKLARENLANLHPHPLYASFYYSHPPVVERIRRLSRTAQA